MSCNCDVCKGWDDDGVCIEEQRDDLESRIAALEAEKAALEAKVAALEEAVKDRDALVRLIGPHRPVVAAALKGGGE